MVAWAKKRRPMFKPHNEQVVLAARQIVANFPDFVDEKAPYEAADPFVVALAYDESHQQLLGQCIVVTQEQYRPGRSKIPTVCQAYDLEYKNIHQMFMAEGWEV